MRGAGGQTEGVHEDHEEEAVLHIRRADVEHLAHLELVAEHVQHGHQQQLDVERGRVGTPDDERVAQPVVGQVPLDVEVIRRRGATSR